MWVEESSTTVKLEGERVGSGGQELEGDQIVPPASGEEMTADLMVPGGEMEGKTVKEELDGVVPTGGEVIVR